MANIETTVIKYFIKSPSKIDTLPHAIVSEVCQIILD